MPTELQSIAKIFNNRLFRIPDYQRGYAWGERQLADFWADLERAGTERTHYCGQLTLERAEKKHWKHWTHDTWLIEDADYEPYFVVDGQQRLTTTVILLQCLLENGAPDDVIAGQKVSELRERYLSKGNDVLRSCLFGYAKDNPSHEFFRTQVLGVPSNQYDGIRTVYTTNLDLALDFFRARVATLQDSASRERVFKALVQRFRFNLYELNDDIDVFVAFETMNNRGKPLSRLELLKNRLIYLSTLAEGTDSERSSVRDNINSVWRTVYEELGKNPTHSLNDDDFLRAHWIIYFGYDKDEADPLTQFLLNKYFTTERLDAGTLTLQDIQQYSASLQISARVWQLLHFPEGKGATLDWEVASALQRLNRLGFAALRPLLLAALYSEHPADQLRQFLNQAERFLLLVRSFVNTRSDTGLPDSYRMAFDLYHGSKSLIDAGQMFERRIVRHFSASAFHSTVEELYAEDGKGFYDLKVLKFLLFEYEEDLRRKAKSTSRKLGWEDFKGARNSIEHIFPQNATPIEWPELAVVKGKRRHQLLHSLGNLVAVSQARNSALARRSFADKKTGDEAMPGYSQGSYSELEVAQETNWGAQQIKARGMRLLEFIERRWQVSLGDEQQKASILNLD